MRSAREDSAQENILTYAELARREHLEANEDTGLTDEEDVELTILHQKAPAEIVSHLSEDVLIWVVCLVVLVYAVAGGLEAAFLTDTIQGIFHYLLVGYPHSLRLGQD